MKKYQKFVALGDSIISDDYPGPGLGAASLLYRNDNERFPKFAGLDLLSHNSNIEFINFSKTGWMIADLLAATSRLAAGKESTLIVLCIGGNDLLQAYAEGTPIPKALQNIGSQLQGLLGELQTRFSALSLRIVNAYDPTDETGKFQSGRYLPDGPQALAALNEVLAQVAGDDLVDIHAHCLGHGMRHSDPSYQHYRAEDPSGWFKMDIEPNNRGAHEIRRAIWETL